MPRGIYSDIICSRGSHPPFTPQEHQTHVLNYFLYDSKEKGLVLIHKLGSGKSCSSIMVSDEMITEAKIRQVFVMTPGSLRQNFIDEYCDRCGFSPEYLKKYYTFITTNYTVGDRLPNLNNSLVIIDEVHNLINGVKNQSKHATLIYKALMKSKCRILALTGTPIVNNIWEWPLLGNLLKPGAFPNIIKRGELYPEIFLQQFVIDKEGNVKPKNKRMFSIELRGIISYFPGRGGGYYPEVIHEKPIQVRMTIPQNEAYWSVATWEQKIRKKGPPDKRLLRDKPLEYHKKMEEFIMASKYIMSRLYSNFYYPEEFRSSSTPETRDEIHHIGRVIKYKYKPTGEVAMTKKYFINKFYKRALESAEKEGKFTKKTKKELSKKILREVKDEVRKNVIPEFEMQNIGWVDRKNFNMHKLSDIYSRKMTALITNVMLNWRAKHMLFTFFKTKAGVNIIHALLKMCGVNTVIYSGDISDSMRRKILRDFNAEKNRYGEKIKMILVTEAGAEGINLLETQHMHILESSTREMKIQQAIGRAVRYRSHSVEGRKPMPKTEQVVHVWRYWSISDPEPFEVKKKIGEEKKHRKITVVDKTGVDEVLYNRGRVHVNAVKNFLSLLKKASVTPYNRSDDKDTKLPDYGLLPEPPTLLASYEESNRRYETSKQEMKMDETITADRLLKDAAEISDEE